MVKYFRYIILLLLVAVGQVVAAQNRMIESNAPSNGYRFSVGENKSVLFSPGNLQYCPAKQEYRFSPHQWEVIGKSNENISSNYGGWIDLFGWGTGDDPAKSSTNYNDYRSFTEWASNRRTLTKGEWEYLFEKRPGASSKWGLAKVNGVNGLVLLPDNWRMPAGCSFASGKENGYGQNYYTAAQWGKMESAGAVFLPAAGYRYGTEVHGVGTYGHYWSSTYDNSDYAYDVYFFSDYVSPTIYGNRYYGLSVRLVQDYVGQVVAAQNRMIESNAPSNGYRFSVGENKSVLFSPGNLQYCPAKQEYRFAPHQWEVIGESNKNISSNYGGWIDLFGWGTGDDPAKSSTNYDDYSSFTEWASNWRTLTKGEWEYLFEKRPGASSKWGLAKVNGVNGLVLLPDNWSMPAGCSFASGKENGYGQNYYTAAQWGKMESAGAVFLPAAGYRSGSGVGTVGTHGLYWSSTYYGSYYAYGMLFGSDGVGPTSSDLRDYGLSVRLVQD